MSDFDPVDQTTRAVPAAPMRLAPTTRPVDPLALPPATDRDAARAVLKDRSARARATSQTGPQRVLLQPQDPSRISESCTDSELSPQSTDAVGEPVAMVAPRSMRHRSVDLCRRLQRKLLTLAEGSSGPIKRRAALAGAAIVEALTNLVSARPTQNTQLLSCTPAPNAASTRIPPTIYPDKTLENLKDVGLETAPPSEKKSPRKRISFEELLARDAKSLSEAAAAERKGRRMLQQRLAAAHESETTALADELERVDMENSRANPEISQIKAAAKGPYASSRFLLLGKVRDLNQQEEREEREEARKKRRPA